MTKTQDKKNSYARAALEKAFKSRLTALIQGLGDAEVGGKGIDLVKEIKELYSMITDLTPNAKEQEQTKIEVGWAEWENINKKPKQDGENS